MVVRVFLREALMPQKRNIDLVDGLDTIDEVEAGNEPGDFTSGRFIGRFLSFRMSADTEEEQEAEED
jgi:hypothetical protein